MYSVLTAIGCLMSEPNVGSIIGEACQPPRKQGNDWGGKQNERSSTQGFGRPVLSYEGKNRQGDADKVPSAKITTEARSREISSDEVVSTLRGDRMDGAVSHRPLLS